MSQVTGEVPGWQHEPWHVSHAPRCRPRCRDACRRSPRRGPTSTRMSASWPRSRRDRGAPGAAARPPKNVSKMSPNPPKPWPPAPPNGVLAAAHVVLLALLRVAQHVVGVGDQLESLGCIGAGVDVGVQLAGESTVRLLDLVGRGVSRDAEDLVMVSHGRPFLWAGAASGVDGGRQRVVVSPSSAGEVAGDGPYRGHVGRVVHAGRAEHAHAGECRAAGRRSRS